MEEQSTSSTSASVETTKKATCVVVLGMAGSGKTAVVQRLTAHLFQNKRRPYVINLDPAVHHTPYPANVDIRDTVNYREVMKQHKLGPNGAIITSLNLFATQFDQVLELLDKRVTQHEHIVVDTPGQIEVFTWSASGSIILESLASQYATCVVYVVDAARSQQPTTFMSNMLYACSILYRLRLPFILVFNKVDIVSARRLHDWMHDFEKFHEAIDEEQTESPSYINDLTRSMSLVLDDFYADLTAVDFSAITGDGCESLLEAIGKGNEEYWRDYRPIYEKLLEERHKAPPKISDVIAPQLKNMVLDAKENDEGEESDDSQAARDDFALFMEKMKKRDENA